MGLNKYCIIQGDLRNNKKVYVSLQTYLQKVPSLECFSDSGSHRRTNATKDHQIFWPNIDGIIECFQTLGVVTLTEGRGCEARIVMGKGRK